MEYNDITPVESRDLGGIESFHESYHGSNNGPQIPMTPGKSAATPLMTNMKKMIDVPNDGTPGLEAALLPPLALDTPGRQPRVIPFIPSLEAAKRPPSANRLPMPRPAVAPPRSMSLDDLRAKRVEKFRAMGMVAE